MMSVNEVKKQEVLLILWFLFFSSEIKDIWFILSLFVVTYEEY